MARAYDAILGQKAYGASQTAPMVNLSHQGQQGYAQNLNTYISNTLYVSKPVIAFLIEAPRGFRDIENGDILVSSLKSFIETHSETIEGLNASITVDVSDAPIGGSNEIQQDIINVMRERSSPTHSATEKYGEAITNFFIHGWIFPFFGDPDTKFPTIANGDVTIEDMLADYVSATVLYVEPDQTGQKVQKAFLCTNMKPSGTFEVVANRDKRSGGQTRQLSVEFTCIQQVGLGVNKFAQEVLDKANMKGANPWNREAFKQKIDVDVSAADEAGYVEQVNKVTAESTL